MKKIGLIIGALVTGLFLTVNVSAQESKPNFFDNTFISGGVGVNYSVPKIAKTQTWGGLGVAADVQFGKWFIPSLGVSLGWSGVTGRANVDLGVPAGTNYALNYVNAKVLWNISNTIGGYKSRLWNFVPYAHLGLLMQGGDGNFFGFGGGLLNLIRLTDKLDLTLDLRALIYHRAPHDIYNTVTCCLLSYPSATVGVSYKLGKSGFKSRKNASAAAPVVVPVVPVQQAAPVNQLSEGQSAPQTQQAQQPSQEAAQQPVQQPAAQNAPEVAPVTSYYVFFELDSAQLQAEGAKILKDIVKANGTDAQYLLKGYADRQTGNSRYNQALSEKRVKTVTDYLVKQGVKKTSIEGIAYGDKEQPFQTPEENRVVIVVLK